jgi:hypothetical protein
MIAFGCPITEGPTYVRFAEPGIQRAKEPDSEMLAVQSSGSIFRTYNMLLDKAKELDDLEALVLLHQDTEIVDEDFCSKLREALRDPDAAIVGCVGAIGIRNISWWEGSVTWANFTHHYEEMGGGELPGLTWYTDMVPSWAETGAVDGVDGFIMALSPWAVRELRFDESLGQLHGYDLDICLQARAAGKKVVTADFRAIHHHSLDLIIDQEAWVAAHMRIAEKWEGHLFEPTEVDWKNRARRAEAELEAMRVQFRMTGIHSYRLAQDLAEIRNSSSWRMMAPLRALGRLLRRIRHPRSEVPYREPGEGVLDPEQIPGLGENPRGGAAAEAAEPSTTASS